MSTINQFDPRVMTQAITIMPETKMFIKNTFFNRRETHLTDTVEFDKFEDGLSISNFNFVNAESSTVNRKGFDNQTFNIPFMNEKIPMTVQDLEPRVMGEHIYIGSSQGDRATVLLRQDLETLNSRFDRRLEIMAFQALWVGEITLLYDSGLTKTIDFGRDASLELGTLAAPKRWDQGTSNPIRDIEDWIKLVKNKSQTMPTDLIMGDDAGNYIRDNTKVLAQLDNRRVEVGEIRFSELPQGVRYLGNLQGIDLWTYNFQYHNGSALVDLVPPKEALLVSRNARRTQHYGAITVKNQNDVMQTYITERFVRRFSKTDPDITFLNMQSKPLFIPENVNASLLVQVIA